MQQPGKRARNVTHTRDRLIAAAVSLYGSRSIDAVSFREIGTAAGQKNPNALQYHFGDRDGLLQAVLDTHTARIERIREGYYLRAAEGEWTAAEAAARCLVMPVVDYVNSEPEGLDFVRIVSQLLALTSVGTTSVGGGQPRFPRPRGLTAVFDRALSGLSAAESRRRVHLAVTTAFHAIPGIYREGGKGGRGAMFEQLLCMLGAFLEAPPLEDCPSARASRACAKRSPSDSPRS